MIEKSGDMCKARAIQVEPRLKKKKNFHDVTGILSFYMMSHSNHVLLTV